MYNAHHLFFFDSKIVLVIGFAFDLFGFNYVGLFQMSEQRIIYSEWQRIISKCLGNLKGPCFLRRAGFFLGVPNSYDLYIYMFGIVALQNLYCFSSILSNIF